MDLQTRLAHTLDVLTLVQLINSAYRGDSSREGWTTEANFIEGLRTDESQLLKILSNSNSKLLILEDRHSPEFIIGCIHIQKISDTESCFGMFTINPKFQAKGHGKTLLLAAENWVIQNWQSKTMSLQVITIRKELISFYERRGYKLTNKVIEFPKSEILSRPLLNLQLQEYIKIL